MSARVRYNAGTAHLNLRALPESDPGRRTAYLRLALAELEEAVRIDPKMRDAQQNLAVTRYRLGDFEGSLAAARHTSRSTFASARAVRAATTSSARPGSVAISSRRRSASRTSVNEPSRAA